MMLATHVDDGRHADAGRVHVEQELGEALVLLLTLLRPCKQVPVCGHLSKARPDLVSIDPPAVGDSRRAGAHRRKVRPGLRFAHSEAEAELATADGRQELFLQTGCSEPKDL